MTLFSKKLTLTAAAILLTSLSGMAQIKIDTGRLEITLPKEVSWALDASPLKMNDDGTVDLPTGEYKFGNCNFSLEYAEIEHNPDFLINIKKSIDGSSARHQRYGISCSSTITRVNDYDTLIFTTKGSCLGHIFFSSSTSITPT